MTVRIVDTTYHLKVGTPQQWATANPILDRGEPGLELLDNGAYKAKFGDGIRHWDQLPYFADLAAHINSGAPHPIYDDGPSLALLYENVKAG